MHAGFNAIRNELPFNARARRRLSPSPAAARDLERISEIWRSCRAEVTGEGAWLFGEFSIADVMYAPVALRLVTYGIEMGRIEQEFVEAVLGLDSVQEWCRDAAAETEAIAEVDELRPPPSFSFG
jgi:glutathione S-transferase